MESYLLNGKGGESDLSTLSVGQSVKFIWCGYAPQHLKGLTGIVQKVNKKRAIVKFREHNYSLRPMEIWVKETS